MCCPVTILSSASQVPKEKRLLSVAKFPEEEKRFVVLYLHSAGHMHMKCDNDGIYVIHGINHDLIHISIVYQNLYMLIFFLFIESVMLVWNP